MQKIRKDDMVVVITGEDKGKSGKVLRIDGDYVVIEGINLRKRHTKGNPQANKTGGIIEREFPVRISNIAHMILNGKGKNGRNYGKIGFKNLEDGRKVRYFKVNNEVVDVG
jgi:large subunit ribosomal protein L24